MKNFRHAPRPRKNTLVIGRQPVIAAIREGVALDRIFLDTRAQGQEINEIKGLATQFAIPVNYVPGAKLDGFNINNHEGCVAQIAKVQYHDLQDMISFVLERGDTPLFLVLDGITDIRNIGGIARTAWCCGVHSIVIPDKGVGALNEDAILTSAGALEKIPVCRINSLMKAVDTFHLNGIRVFATEMNAETSIDKADLTIPTAIVMGSEDKGIYPTLLKACDEKISIPMPGEFESLNVSVATGIILYEAIRQRGFKV